MIYKQLGQFEYRTEDLTSEIGEIIVENNHIHIVQFNPISQLYEGVGIIVWNIGATLNY